MREFRTIQLGRREIFGVLISSGVRIEEVRAGEWVYHSTQPDLDAARSLLRSIGKPYGLGTEMPTAGGNWLFIFTR